MQEHKADDRPFLGKVSRRTLLQTSARAAALASLAGLAARPAAAADPAPPS